MAKPAKSKRLEEVRYGDRLALPVDVVEKRETADQWVLVVELLGARQEVVFAKDGDPAIDVWE